MTDSSNQYYPVSVFDMFKIGVGPSSSHTLGPWRAALHLLQYFSKEKMVSEVESVQIFLYGSLAKTGKGHGTDVALQMGLIGEDPETCDIDNIGERLAKVNKDKSLLLNGINAIPFDPERDIQFLVNESLSYHPNALTFMIKRSRGVVTAHTYYSVGGGFIQQEGEETAKNSSTVPLPFPIQNSEDLLHWCRTTGMNIHEIVLENELSWRSARRDGKRIISHLENHERLYLRRL